MSKKKDSLPKSDKLVVIKTPKSDTRVNTTNAIRNTSFIFKVLGIILLVLLLFNLARSLLSNNGNTQLTFYSFLKWLSTNNSFRFDTSFVDLTIKGDWGLFNGFKNFLNITMTAWSIIVFCAKNLFGVIMFILSFVKFMFVS